MIKKIAYLLQLFIPTICFSQVTYNFESGSLTGWLQVPSAHWQASTATPISGSYSLKHSVSSGGATDRISIALPSWNPISGNVTWQVKVHHGYDPSSSNRWWIYLMTDKDANQMLLGGTCSGYAIGVNLTDSDDLLKLWRVDNGIAQSALTATLNWQTLITTSGIGAIEVERAANGTFTLKASTTGSFSNLINYGSIKDNTYADFYYYCICYNCTSSGDLKLWVDDISLSYTTLNKNDITTEVLNPASQVAAFSISSTSNSPSSAMDVLKFRLKDNGSGDNLPTKVKSITFKKGTSTNAANWINAIGGVRLRGESGEVSILSQSVSADKINLVVDSTTLTIPDGQTKEYTLSLFLKSNNLIDGSTLKFYIDSIYHGFAAGLSGSDFVNTFTRRILSNEFKIDVAATALKITQQPNGISKNAPFSLSSAGADSAGNIDKEFSNDITLSLSQGNGLLTSIAGLTKTPTLGTSSWSDLQYNTSGTLRILASSTGVNQIESNVIIVLNDSTSVVTSAASQPIAIGISSLNTFPASAVEVFRFRIHDNGETDGLPTIVKTIKISRVEITDAASLNKVIGGVLVKVKGIPVGISEPDIKTSYFTISFSNNNLVVPNGEYADVGIYIYLNEEGLTDNQKIQLKVDATNHGFTTYPSGSKFNSTFPSQVTSNIFWIDVVATQQKFTSIPARVGVLQPFNVTLNAIDIHGNTDKNFTGSEKISLLTGNGNLIIPSGSTFPITEGGCTFSLLTYSIPERFSLLASCPTLNNIASSLITCGDSDGGIAKISSVNDSITVYSTSTSPQYAIEVMNLNIFDAGTTDGLALIHSKINLFCFDPSTSEQLYRQIGGFVLKADNKIIDVNSYSLINGVFEIIPKAGSLIIANKDTVTLSISIYLNKGTISDNFPFRFYVPAANHGWTSASTGTGFASSFSSSIYGPECSLKVEATKLKFTKTPFTVIPSEQFSVSVCAVDYFGNIDIDYTDQLTLSLEDGAGTFSCSNINQDLGSGYAEWNDVAFNKIGTYRLKSTGPLLGGSISDEIICGIDKNCLIQEDFEGNLNTNWVGSNDWFLSTISPINGSKSLQQKQSTNSGISILSIPVKFPSIGDELIEWDFTLRNGDWDPSTDNYFYVALMSDSSDLKSGYFIGINPSLGNDILTLWKSVEGVMTPIITSSFDWDPSNEGKIRVELTPHGEWRLWYQPKSDQLFSYGGEGKSLINAQMSWSGLVFGHTSSRSGQLWMDDLSICTTDYPPVLLSAKPINLNTIKVSFSEKIDQVQALVKSNYSIENKDGISIKINNISSSIDLQNEVFLKTDQLPFEKLMLKVDNIADVNGSSIRDSIYFGLSESGSFGRLIINEIMASPEPSVGLPSYEYIELYNPTVDTISLSGWSMQMNSYSLNLPNDTIFPNQHAILCSTSAVKALSVFGKSIGVTSFPALLNSGMSLRLFDSGGSVISLVNYSENWYADDMKKSGGWSLEKIDYQNLMEGKGNWKASVSSNGGTPCAVNSVATENPDITPPRLLSLEVQNERTIQLTFSEPMDSLMLTFSHNFDIDNGIGHPTSATLIGGEYSSVLLTIANPLQPSIKYNLCLNQNITDFSGNQVANYCVPIGLPQMPVWNDIVINEVLFNPNTCGVDFVELYNRSNKTFDLSKMALANRNSVSNLLDQINSISDTSRLIFPSDYAVITISPKLVKEFYHTENDKVFVGVSNMASFNNDKGNVVLLTNDLTVIDELSYTEKMHSKLLNDFKGVSLERINPDLVSSSSSTWQSAAQTSGFATPTYKNSQWVEPSVKNDAFTLSPETFSPDGDGRDDYLLISYKLQVDGCIANIRVFSANGIEVKRLASNLLIGTEGTLTWDGLNSSNQKVPIGIYIVYIEYYNPKGEVTKYKKTCVVAERF